MGLLCPIVCILRAVMDDEGIAVAQVETIVQPDGVANDVRGDSVAFGCIHAPTLSIPAH